MVVGHCRDYATVFEFRSSYHHIQADQDLCVETDTISSLLYPFRESRQWRNTDMVRTTAGILKFLL